MPILAKWLNGSIKKKSGAKNLYLQKMPTMAKLVNKKLKRKLIFYINWLSKINSR
jgi:hypothetical protein